MTYSRSSAGELRRIALAEGKTHFNTGKPCKHGHECARYAKDGHCIECVAIATGRINKAKRHGPNGDAWRAQALAARNIWLQRPDVKEMLAVKGKIWSVAYRRRHPIHGRVYFANRRAQWWGADGTITVPQIKAMLQEQKFKCASCGVDLGKDFHIDHQVPLSRKGSNHIENIACLCATCNRRKHCFDHIEWAKMNGRPT